MEHPEMNSLWQDIHGDIVSIVHPNTPNGDTKRPVVVKYRYHRTNHIGGCNSLEWFYEIWKPLK